MLVLRALSLLPRSMRDRLIRGRMRIDERELQGVTVKVADEISEYVDAARLVHDGYVKRRIIRAHGSGVRLTPFLALPSTIIFVALRDKEVKGTLSLVCDSSLKLPMDKIYGPELDELRTKGRRLAEVGALCLTADVRGSGVAFLLYKAMWQCAELLGLSDLVVAVHPSAAQLYEAMLRFERIGPLRTYPSMTKEAKAVALRLRLTPEGDHAGARETFRAAFGSLPKTARNPHWLYVERIDPQICLPTSASFVDGLRELHQRASLKLTMLRPDIVTQMNHDEFEQFRHEMK